MKLRVCMILLIAMVLLAPITISAYPDEPTDDELAGWWAGITTEERLEELRKLDRYQHELPDIDFPDFNVVVTDDEIIMSPRAPLTIWLVDLGWTIQGPEHRAAYEPVKPSLWRIGLTWFGVGALAGFALSLIIP